MRLYGIRCYARCGSGPGNRSGRVRQPREQIDLQRSVGLMGQRTGERDSFIRTAPVGDALDRIGALEDALARYELGG